MNVLFLQARQKFAEVLAMSDATMAEALAEYQKLLKEQNTKDIKVCSLNIVC
jgi:hypothetical protein